jgi:two-component system, NtrC family, sensor kinase
MNYKHVYIPGQEKTHEVPEDEVPPDKRKILVLDDDKDFIFLLREFLIEQHFEVIAVENGVEGVKQVMATDFDIILCDMAMPKLSGDMFYLAVERTKPHLCKRFIFMTGHSGDAKITEFIRRVRGLVLWKPFELYMLTEAIKTVLKKSGAGQV